MLAVRPRTRQPPCASPHPAGTRRRTPVRTRRVPPPCRPCGRRAPPRAARPVRSAPRAGETLGRADRGRAVGRADRLARTRPGPVHRCGPAAPAGRRYGGSRAVPRRSAVRPSGAVRRTGRRRPPGRRRAAARRGRSSWPTAPAPQTATTSPGRTSPSSAPSQPVGAASEANSARSSLTASGTRNAPDVGVRHPDVLGVTAGEAARRRGWPKQPAVRASPGRRRLSPGRCCRCRSRNAGPAGSTSSRRRRPRRRPPPGRRPGAGVPPDRPRPPHPGTRAEHVTGAQQRVPTGQQRQVGTAGGAAPDPDDGVLVVAQLRVGHLAYRQLVGALPAQRPHPGASGRSSAERSARSTSPVSTSCLTWRNVRRTSSRGSSPTRWAARPTVGAAPASGRAASSVPRSPGAGAHPHLDSAAQAAQRLRPPAVGKHLLRRRGPPSPPPTARPLWGRRPHRVGDATGVRAPAVAPWPARRGSGRIPCVSGVPSVPSVLPDPRPPIVGRHRVKRARPEGVNRRGSGNRRRPGVGRVGGGGAGCRNGVIACGWARHRGLPGEPPLLASRLTPAAPPEPVVARPRLLRRLDEGSAGPVTLVTAPAGWGKTTLLARRLGRHAGGLRAGRRRAAVAPGRRGVGLGGGGRRRGPALVVPGGGAADRDRGRRTPTRWRRCPPAAPRPDQLELLAAGLAARERPVLLVLDDLHRVTDPAALTGLEFLLRHAEGRLRLVVGARTGLPLAAAPVAPGR